MHGLYTCCNLIVIIIIDVEPPRIMNISVYFNANGKPALTEVYIRVCASDTILYGILTTIISFSYHHAIIPLWVTF